MRPLQFPLKKISGKRKEGGGGGGEKEKFGLTALASNLCEIYQPAAFLLLLTLTCTPLNSTTHKTNSLQLPTFLLV